MYTDHLSVMLRGYAEASELPQDPPEGTPNDASPKSGSPRWRLRCPACRVLRFRQWQGSPFFWACGYGCKTVLVVEDKQPPRVEFEEDRSDALAHYRLTDEDTWRKPIAGFSEGYSPAADKGMHPRLSPETFSINTRDMRDRYYEEATELYRVPAASNWPFGRHRPKVKKYREGLRRW